jgi:hypothetical protein
MTVSRPSSILWGALVCAGVAMAFGAGTASAVESHPHVGSLPGFPRVRGVVPLLNSPATVSAHERLVNHAFSAARARGRTLEPGRGQAGCPVEFAFTQNVCYQGGPVLRKPIVHLIFWQGPLTPNVEPFPAHYVETVERYFEDVREASGLSSDVYAVDPQYGESEEPGVLPGVNGSSFDRAADAAVDSIRLFPEKCTDNTPFSKGPCLLDADIQKEVTEVAEEITHKWPTGNLENVFLVFTPPGVGSCAEFGCAYQAYCAYHSDFGGGGIYPPGNQTIYANMPFAAPGACDSGVHPNEAKDEGTDAAIDAASHEFNEAITDPLGSQCKSETECEPISWTDAIGQEIADKCLPPESTIAGLYGEPLGTTTFEDGFYNQLINANHYWTQREWSNEAGLFEGGCVQRAINASFSVSPGAAATVPTTLDGSTSGAPGDPAVYWVWSFDEGEQVGSSSAKISHTFAHPGAQQVGLTAYDAYGNAEGAVELVNVGAAPILLSPPPPPAPSPPATKEAASALAHFTVAQVAAKLGLPANGRKLVGSGPLALGHAECPPACAVTLQLYARMRITTHGHRSTKLVSIGLAHLTLAAKGNAMLSLTLGAKGRTMLRRLRTLPCRLQATVEGQEGGTWQIVRSLTLRR